MKRSPSSSPVSDVPTTPTKIKKSSANSTPKSSSKKSPWDAEKKKALMEIIFETGVAHLKATDVAERIGVAPQNYTDATRKGRKNLRAYVIRAAKDAPASGSAGTLE